MQGLWSRLPGVQIAVLADILNAVLSLLCPLTPQTHTPFLAAMTGPTLHSQQGWWWLFLSQQTFLPCFSAQTMLVQLPALSPPCQSNSWDHCLISADFGKLNHRFLWISHKGMPRRSITLPTTSLPLSGETPV